MTDVKNNTQLSFWQLISNTSKIEIPIIQRDYAQGRVNEKTNKIRKRFLKSLINTAIKDEGLLELDFVYGNIEKEIFQPLDGQQRLTTLFLLHWYIAQNLSKLQETKNEFLKFTYETRISSREFCNELVNKGEFLGAGKTISEQIKDSTWFFLSWQKDPTINAMLTMLNSIEEEIKRHENINLQELWSKLTSETSPIIFHFKELKDIGLTDDLYIKMNARGKELTDFEHFKARFEKCIEENKWENIVDNPQLTFSHKIDTVWTDLFWKHRGDDNLVDNEFINFIAGIAINWYAQEIEIQENKELDTFVRKELEEKSKGKPVTEEAVKRERIEQRIVELFNNPNDVSPEDFTNKDAFEYLNDCFDIYSEKRNDKFFNDELLPDNLPLWEYCKRGNNDNVKLKMTLFTEFIKDTETTYKQRVLFFAQTHYLLSQANFIADSFSNWLRVVRNIIQNSTIDSAGAFIGAIGLINEVAKGNNDIYKFLSVENIKSGFASNQIEEEVLKSKVISTENSNKEVIFLTEDTNFCKGRIKFALFCIDFKNTENIFDVKALSNIQNVINEHLSEVDISNDFRRGLFTIKDNNFYNYWTTSWLYAVDAPKRCLIENIIELKNYAYNSHFRDYLKEILLKLTYDKLNDLINNYIIPDNMPNWKKRIIKEEGLLDFSNRHFIAVDEDNCCWLIPQSKVANSKEGVRKCKKIE